MLAHETTVLIPDTVRRRFRSGYPSGGQCQVKRLQGAPSAESLMVAIKWWRRRGPGQPIRQAWTAPGSAVTASAR